MEPIELIQRADGDAEPDDAATRALYAELKAIAASELRRHAPQQTLNTTAVVHEAYAKLAELHRGAIADRSHFLRLAARAMRQVIIDAARARIADKRGAGAVHLSLGHADEVGVDGAVEILELEAALALLAREEPRAAKVVEYHVYGGMSFQEVADLIGVSEKTARNDWTYARAVLAEALGKS